MSANDKGVDVLAVMDRIAADALTRGDAAEEILLSHVRAAVAELVEVASEVARLNRVMAGSKVAMYIPIGADRHERLRAAVTRCGGAK